MNEVSFSDQALQIGMDSIVEFFPLTITDQGYVGRMESGDFVALPEEGVRVIELLRQGETVQEVEARLSSELGVELDVADFAGELIEFGFVKAIDGEAIAQAVTEVRGSLAWLRPEHIAWLFRWPTAVAAALVMAAAILTVALDPSVFPSYVDYFWSTAQSVVVGVNTLLFFAGVFVHESAHLLVARSLGVPARLELSTRLTDLVVQTEMTGLWSVSRRDRIRGYVAGMITDLIGMSVALLLLGHMALPEPLPGLLAVVVINSLAGLSFQLSLYMKTDLYFVLMDVSQCHNLFDDAMAFLRFTLQRLGNSLLARFSSAPGEHPLADLPRRERNIIRAYSGLVVVGGFVTLVLTAFYGIPIMVFLLIEAIRDIFIGFTNGNVLRLLDGFVVLAIEGSLQLLFVVTFLREKSRWWANRRQRSPAHDQRD